MKILCWVCERVILCECVWIKLHEILLECMRSLVCVCVCVRGRQVIINMHDLWVFYSKVSAWKITAPISLFTTHSPSSIRSCNNIEIDHNRVLTAAAVNNSTQRNWVFLLLITLRFPPLQSCHHHHHQQQHSYLWKNRQIFFLLLSARGRIKMSMMMEEIIFIRITHSTHPSVSC